MQLLTRMIGLGFIALSLLALGLKMFVALPGPLGYAPIDLGLGPTIQPVEVVIWYGTEKEAWLEEAAGRFTRGGASVGGRPIKLTLVGMGSREIAERVAREEWQGDPRPTVVSPASSIWTDALRSDWGDRSAGASIIAGAVTPLVLTPLVAVAWEERARVLWPSGVGRFWPELHDALADRQGWAGVAARNGFAAGSPEAEQARSWGLVKFGHTSPLRSNSGAQALILMAYGYYDRLGDLAPGDVLDPGFQSWVETIELAVLDFGASTGTFMTNMVQLGPSKYDLVLVYENLAIEQLEPAEGRWGQALRVYYPPATIFSDHPYAVLGEPLTSPEQRAAAEQFRAFLLAQPQQELALQHGFRPADPDVPIMTGDPANPFNRYAAYGVQVAIAQQVERPTSETLNTLLELWRRRIAAHAARFEGEP